MRLGAYVAKLDARARRWPRPTATRSCPSATATATSSTRASAAGSTRPASCARARRPTGAWSSSSSSTTTRSGSAPRPTPSSRAGPNRPAPLFRELIARRAGPGRGAQPPHHPARPRARLGFVTDRAGFARLGEREVYQGHVIGLGDRHLPGAGRLDLRARHRAPPGRGGRGAPARRRPGGAGAPVPGPHRPARCSRSPPGCATWPARPTELTAARGAGRGGRAGRRPLRVAVRVPQLGRAAATRPSCIYLATGLRAGRPATARAIEEQHMTIEHVALADARRPGRPGRADRCQVDHRPALASRR